MTLSLSLSRRSGNFALFAFVIATFCWPLPALGHGEAIEIGESAVRGPVALDSAQTKALGLELAEADFRPIAKLLTLYGKVTVWPDKQAEATARIRGRVAAVYANVGDVVQKGDRLALLEARTVGDPPPTVLVRAPISGTVDRRTAVLGQPIDPSNSSLFHISQLDRVRVLSNVYEEDLHQIRPGQEANVFLLAYPKRVFRGKVELVGPTLDPDTRTSEVWISLENPEGLLKPDLFTKTDVVIGSNPAALTIPNDALLSAQGETFVFVKQGDRFDRVEVVPGIRDDEFTEVTSGLVPGDQVVTQGVREVYTVWLTGDASGD